MVVFKQCNDKNIFRNEVESYVDYSDTVKFYKALNGDVIAYNESLEISEKTLMTMNDSLSKAIKNIKMKDPGVIIQIKEKIVIKEVEVRFTDSIPCFPFYKPFGLEHEFYSLSGSVTNTMFKLDSIQIPNIQSIVLGTKKNGLFKKNDHIVTIQNSNPYVNTGPITSYTIKKKKKWFESAPFQIGLGFVAGVITTKTLGK